MAIPVDITLNPDNSMDIVILSDFENSKSFFNELRSTLSGSLRDQEGYLQILEIVDSDGPVLQIRILNLQQIQNSFNFIDYHRAKSFFKEKYYFKMLLNARMFDSELFTPLKNKKHFLEQFNRLLGPDPIFEFQIEFPGRCTTTNMNRENNHLVFRTDYRTINSRGTLLTFESSRFIPSVSITMIALLFLLILILGRYIFRMKVFRQHRS